MGPVDWPAVVLAALLAAMVVKAVARDLDRRGLAQAAALMLVSAAMLGHNFARIGAQVLAAKPWLYFMQSGGLALAFVIPALWIVRPREGAAMGETWRHSAAFLLAYLAMGAVFLGLA